MGSNVTIAVLSNDEDPDGTLDPATVTVIDPPDNGLAVEKPLTGEIVYTPNPGFVGVDTFTYEVCDNDGLCSNEATVTVNVSGGGPPGQNVAPVAIDDTASTQRNTPVDITIVDIENLTGLPNDYDVDGNIDLNSITLINPASHGTVFIDTLTGIATLYTCNRIYW